MCMKGCLKMATYKEIQDYVRTVSGYTPKTCWIAHCKEIYGLTPRIAPNRQDVAIRKFPCPEDKQEDIRKAFQFFGMKV